ncbi:MAG: hypothetical protein QHH14_11390 [Clostridiales bacterium]|jgi:hypothetical protein|nr:hypothetical protein [Clostridiales bacterium]
MKREQKKIAFEALIQQVSIKSLRSGDKSMRIVLEVDQPGDKLVSTLNELHRADRFVAVGIAEIKE